MIATKFYEFVSKTNFDMQYDFFSRNSTHGRHKFFTCSNLDEKLGLDVTDEKNTIIQYNIIRVK